MNNYQRNLMRLRGFCDGAGAKPIRIEYEEDTDYCQGYKDGQQAKSEYALKSAAEFGVVVRKIVPLGRNITAIVGVLFVALLACSRLASAQSGSITVPTNSPLTVGTLVWTNDTPPSLAITALTTNRYTNTLSTLRVEPILTPCPECGKANHHERRVELAEMFDVVYATLVSGGQTNVAVTWKGPKLQSVVTNTVTRPGVPVWRQPGQVTPIPPLTNAPPTP